MSSSRIPDSELSLPHERLDAYRLAVEVNRWFAGLRFPMGRAHLRDQGQRAADSVVCNIAEGINKGRRTNAGRHALRIARGEAGELAAILDCIALPGGTLHQQKLRRIAMKLTGLMR